MTNLYGYIFDVKKFALHDGPGIRTTVFLKGCPLNCLWCHNPESIKNNNGNNNHCDESSNFITKKYSTDEVFELLRKDILFYDESQGGVTFSGGEPLVQIDFLESILKLCKKNHITTTIDTCGYAPTESFERIYPFTDIFLYDLKLFDNDLHLKYTGVSNELIKKNLEYLHNVNANIIIRIPLIPEITDNEHNMKLIAEYLVNFKNISKIDLLPYNELAEDKYRRLNQKSKLGKLKTQSEEKLREITELIESFGFSTKLNG